MKPHHQATRLTPRWVFLGCPLVSLVLGLLLFADAANMPHTTPVGRFFKKPITYPDSVFFITSMTPTSKQQTAQPLNQKYRLLDIDRESSNELTRLLTQNTLPVAEVRLTRQTKTTGIWSAWTARMQSKLTLEALNEGWTKTDLQDARDRLLSHHDSIANIDSFSARFLSTLDRVRNPEKPILHWQGPTNDLAVLTLWFLLGLSVFRWRAWFALHPFSRTRYRIAKNQCPACGYSLHNLPSDTCPECGTPLNQNRA